MVQRKVATTAARLAQTKEGPSERKTAAPMADYLADSWAAMSAEKWDAEWAAAMAES